MELPLDNALKLCLCLVLATLRIESIVFGIVNALGLTSKLM